MSRIVKRIKNYTTRLRLTLQAGHAKRKMIRALRSASGPIIVGPWISEVGFELLYWIPFLQWVREVLGMKKENVIAISRGGVASWYANVALEYRDIFDYAAPEEFAQFDRARKLRRHLHMHAFEQRIVNAAAQDCGIKKFTLIHPSTMYRMFMPFWKQRASVGLVKAYTKFEAFGRKPFDSSFLGLPQEYAAVKFYFNEAFPETEETKQFIRILIGRIAKKIPVVLLNSSGIALDDHAHFRGEFGENIFDVKKHLTPRNNLDIQTKIISRARFFVGNYGGFSYISSLLGVPSFGFYAQGNFAKTHTDVSTRVFSGHPFPYGALTLLHIKDYDALSHVLTL